MTHSLKVYFLLKNILSKLKIVLLYSKNVNIIGFSIFYNQYFLIASKINENLYFVHNNNLTVYSDNNSILKKFHIS